MENQTEIRGLLQDKFQDHEATPPRDIWAEIDAEIHPSKTRKIVWWPYLAVAASALILFGVWSLLGTAPNPTVSPFAEENPKQIPTQIEEVIPAPQTQEEPFANNLSQTDNAELEEAKAAPRNLFHTTAQREVVPVPKSQEFELTQQDAGQTPSNSGSIALNPISPIDPRLAMQDIPIQPEQPAISRTRPVSPEEKSQTIDQGETQLRPVNDSKLNLNEFSLQNVVAFASNEISKLSGSPLEYKHQRGQDAERTVYAFELGDFKITRTSFRKTINQ